jgi:hypothetical protein
MCDITGSAHLPGYAMCAVGHVTTLGNSWMPMSILVGILVRVDPMSQLYLLSKIPTDLSTSFPGLKYLCEYSQILWSRFVRHNQM